MRKIETQKLACPLFVTVHTLWVSNPQEIRLVTRTASFVIAIHTTHYGTCGFVEIFAADLAGHGLVVCIFPGGSCALWYFEKKVINFMTVCSH